MANPDCKGGTNDFFHSLHLATLSTDMHASLLSEVTTEEIFSTLKNMPRNKTPGPDGYTVEFF